jgi:response regulator RpfG family c-di-GMP phosphodiesterase
LDLHGKKAGYELAKISKENKIYTVILTGQKDRASISKAFEYSKCDNYLFKPANSKLVNDVLAHFDSASGSDPVVVAGFWAEHAFEPTTVDLGDLV